MKPFLISTALGALISALWYAPPGSVTSIATLSAKGLESPLKADELEQRLAQATQGLRSRDRLAPVIQSFDLYPGMPLDEAVAIMQRSVTFERVRFGPSQAVSVSFRYPNRFHAQRTAMWFAAEIAHGDRTFRLIDPASLPTDRTHDYRLAAGVLGLPVGFIIGLILSWRPTRPRTLVPVTL